MHAHSEPPVIARGSSANNLQQKQLEQYRCGHRRCNFTLRASDGREFRVHDNVLMGASAYLERALDDADGDSYSLPIPGLVLELCVEFMYGVAPDLEGVNLDAIAAAADLLELDGLVDSLCHSTAVSVAKAQSAKPDELIGLFERWEQKEELRDAVFSALLRDFAKVAEHDSWLMADRQLVSRLLGSERLVVRHEGIVYDALVRWLNAQRRALTPDATAALLRLVRMPPLFSDDADRERALPASVLTVETAADEELPWLRLLCDAALVGTPWESLHPLRTTLLARLVELGVPDTDGTVDRWMRAHAARPEEPPPLVVAARHEPLFDNAPCLRIVLDRTMAPREPAARHPESTHLCAVGGSDGSHHLASVERFDPDEGVWEPVVPMSSRRNQCGVGVLGGKLYAVGGHEGFNALASVERYDPETGVWTPVSPMGRPRHGVGVEVLGNKLYAVGGNDDDGYCLSSVERYDPAVDAWEAVAPLTLARFGAGVAALEGKLYAVGGYYEAAEVERPAHSVERYDPSSNAWEEVAPMATARAFPFALLM